MGALKEAEERDRVAMERALAELPPGLEGEERKRALAAILRAQAKRDRDDGPQ